MLKNTRRLLVMIVVAFIAALTGCQSQKTESVDVQVQSIAPAVEAPKEEEQIPEDLKGFTEYMVKKHLGDKSHGGKDRAKSITINGSGNENAVVIELNGNDAYTSDMTVRGMLMDSKKVLEPLSKRQDVNSVSISEYLDVDDIGGGKVEEWVFTLILDRGGLDKVASGDFLLNDLTTIAKEYKLHPNFTRNKAN